MALHSLGDEINPQSQEPRFNRPEDAEGFMQSGAEPGVDGDEDSKRRQREELMYWNAIHLERLAKEKSATEKQANGSREGSFDDFLEQDKNAEKGTFVYNTGADVNTQAEEGLRNRGVRGLNRSSIYANPFADENHIDWDEQRAIDASLMAPEESEKVEVMSEGLYSAHEDHPHPAIQATIASQLIDVSDPPISYPEPEPEIEDSTNYTNMAPRDSVTDSDAFASIHAWADNANQSFYSPLPTSEAGSFPDPPESVPGDMTPTYASSHSSGEEVWAPISGATSEGGVEADIQSVASSDGEGVSTPGSWTEVGSVVSENDVAMGVHA